MYRWSTALPLTTRLWPALGLIIMTNMDICTGIIGGTTSIQHAFPNIAWLEDTGVFSLTRKDRLRCSGILVGYKHVLTTCKCARSFSGNIRVHFGDHDLSIEGEPCEQVHDVRKVQLCNKKLDAAILVLERNVDLTTVHPVTGEACVMYLYPDCLAPPEAYFNKFANAIGWGSNETGANHIPDKMQLTTLTIRPGGTCNVNEKTHVCCGGRTSARYQGACHGDAGTPLVIGPTLVGMATGNSQDCDKEGGSSPYVLMSALCHRVLSRIKCNLPKSGSWSRVVNTDNPFDGLDQERADFKTYCRGKMPYCMQCRLFSNKRCSKSHSPECKFKRRQKLMCSLLTGMICSDDTTSVIMGKPCPCCDYQAKYACPP